MTIIDIAIVAILITFIPSFISDIMSLHDEIKWRIFDKKLFLNELSEAEKEPADEQPVDTSPAKKAKRKK